MLHVYHNTLHIFTHQDHKPILWLYLKNLDNLLQTGILCKYISKVQINFNAHPYLIHQLTLKFNK